jgi:hypothetical protein
MFTRREVATASEDTPAQEALRRLDAREFGYNTPFSQTTLESLYRNHGQYVALVAQESNRLVREGFWLRPDAQEVIKQAAQADVP